MGAWLAQSFVDRTVMAGRTTGMSAHHDARMVVRASSPGRVVPRHAACVTGVALCSESRNVCPWHGLGILRGISTVVAVRTIVGSGRRIGAGVIHRTRIETGEPIVVAGVTLGTGRNMSSSRRLRQGIDCHIAAVVTGQALAGRTGVVHASRLESGVIAVAGVTLCRRRDMRTGRLTQRRGAIVASRTGANGCGRMHEGSTGPYHC